MHIFFQEYITQRGATLFRNTVTNVAFLTLAGFAVLPLKSRLL